MLLEELRTGQCSYEVSGQTFSRRSLRLDQTNINRGLKAAARTLSVTTLPPEEKKNEESHIAIGHPVDLSKVPCSLT